MDQPEAMLLRIMCVAFSHLYPTAEIMIPSARSQIEMMEEDSESTIIDTNKDCQESQETLEKGGVKQPLLKWSSYFQSSVAPHKGFKLLKVGCLFH